MLGPAAALEDQNAELARLVADLDGDAWQRPSRCPGWTVADVLLHLAQTNEMAAGSARGRFLETLDTLAGSVRQAGSVDDGAATLVERERGRPGDAVRARWQGSVRDLYAALAEGDPKRRVTWVAGELSLPTLTTTRLAETWIHTGDIADALGVVLPPTERLWHIARLAWRTVPYAFASAGRELAGPVTFSLVSPTGEAWEFTPDEPPVTRIVGDAVELCDVAARRVAPGATHLRAEGADGSAVLELVRTFA